MTSYTPSGAAQAIGKLAKTLTKEHVKAFRRVLGKVKTEAIKGFVSRGIGRTIFSKSKSNARKLMKRQRVKVFNDGQIIAGGLEIVGLAALQEAGGTTKRHPIPKAPVQKGGRLLVFQGRKGLVFARQVNHPGSRIPAMPFAEPALRRATGAIEEEFEKATQAAANTVG